MVFCFQAFTRIARNLDLTDVNFPFGFELQSLLAHLLSWPELVANFLVEYEAQLQIDHPDMLVVESKRSSASCGKQASTKT